MSLAVGSCSGEDFALAQLLLNNSQAATTVCSSFNVSAYGGVSNAAMAYTISQVQAVASSSLAQVQQQLDAAQAQITGMRAGLNMFFVATGAFNIFLMQTGFAMFIAGLVRPKNISSVLLKSAIDTVISAICFYLVGYAFETGQGPNPNGFVGNAEFALGDSPPPVASDRDLFVWNWSFCAVATTVMAGSIAERSTFISYCIYAAFFSSWVYPVIAHWSWSPNGWLSAYNANPLMGVGVIDFAGSGVVHTCGGFAAAVGAIVLGPRHGRYDSGVVAQQYQQGPNPALYLLGSFLLWFGWYSFNAMCLLAIDTAEAANVVARITTTTTLAGASAGVASIGLSYYRTRTYNMLDICVGMLGGMVAITAGCSVVEPWAAIICGVVAAPCVIYGELVMQWFKVDDPGMAFSIHGLSGIWGVLFVGLLANGDHVTQVYGQHNVSGLKGIFYGGRGQILLCQFISVLVIVSWTVFWIYLLFKGMSLLGILRVPLDEEAMGLDAAAMGTVDVNAVLPQQTKMSDASSKSLMSSYISQRIQDASASRRFTFASPSVNGAAARPLPTRQYSVPQLTVPASTNVDAAQPAEEGAAAAAAASVRANVTAPSAPDAAASDTSGTVELTFWASSPIAASKQQKSPSPLGV